nr:MAG TPA: hypothetical protein [Caudoviricetes sp.]
MSCHAKYRGGVRRTEGLENIGSNSNKSGITLSPCVSVREYRGSAHRARGLKNTVKKIPCNLLTPLLRNSCFFGVSPIMLTRLSVMLRDTARRAV